MRIVLFFVLLSLMLPGGVGGTARGDALSDAFAKPPGAARPWVQWVWMEGAISKEGITNDLESFARNGIGGVFLLHRSAFLPRGRVSSFSPEWRACFRHALAEADRLGIAVSLGSVMGETSAGGPWIAPAQAMQQVVWSETRVSGPRMVADVIGQPPTQQGHYRDIALLAVPVPAGDDHKIVKRLPKLTTSANDLATNATKLLDGLESTFIELPKPKADAPQYFQYEFEQPFEACSFTLNLGYWATTCEGKLQISDDGREFRDVRPFAAKAPGSTFSFDKVAARFYRFSITKAFSYQETLAVLNAPLFEARRLEGLHQKASFGRGEAGTRDKDENFRPEGIIKRAQIIDLTTKLDKTGRLTWNAPVGDWLLLRFGHTATGTLVGGSVATQAGLECDKLSKTAVSTHYNTLFGELKKELRQVPQRAVSAVELGSWPKESQNWTPLMREEFTRRRGYDPLLLLPVLTARPVDSAEVSERFLWDLRQTIAELAAENSGAHFAALCQNDGVRFWAMPFGDMTLDEPLFLGNIDVPMGSFTLSLTGPGRGGGMAADRSIKLAASVAATTGKSLVAVRGGWSRPQAGAWRMHPYLMKPFVDQAFCEGMTQLNFHAVTHQPWPELKPGLTYAGWGAFLGPGDTWWEKSLPWHEYVARCQQMLRQGRAVADLCYVLPEGTSNGAPARANIKPAPPMGFDYDFCAPQLVIEKMTVREGRLTLPSGASYCALVLPEIDRMTPALARKIKQLAEEGATIVGPPPAASPSLQGYPESDAEIKKIAAEMWANCDGKAVRERAFGKGRIVYGLPLSELLAAQKIAPDFAASGAKLQYVHRVAGEVEIYFVSSLNAAPAAALASFRVSGKQPELWFPDTGKIETVAFFQSADGLTKVPLRFEPQGSVFVVFRPVAPANTPAESVAALNYQNKPLLEAGTAPALPSLTAEESASGVWKPAPEITREGRSWNALLWQAGEYEVKTSGGKSSKIIAPALPAPLEIKGPWTVEFPPDLGAPQSVEFERLQSWHLHTNPGVRYFSGGAIYHKKINVPAEFVGENRRVFLDMGRVAVMAHVAVNGNLAGIVWKPPYRLNVTEWLRAGENLLQIQVTNLWVNRIIGDEQLPDDLIWNPPGNIGGVPTGAPLKQWPEWLIKDAPRTSQRVAFHTLKFYDKDSPLLESGLLGPVRLLVAHEATVQTP